jgi:hypothetical protein
MAKVKYRVGINGSINQVFAALTTDTSCAGSGAYSAAVKAQPGVYADLIFENLVVLKFRYQNIHENKKVRIQRVKYPGPWQEAMSIRRYRALRWN